MILFYSLGGSTRHYAQKLHEWFRLDGLLQPSLHDLAEIDCDDFFAQRPHAPHELPFYLVLLPTYDIPTTLDDVVSQLSEIHHDFRVGSVPLRSVNFAVFAFGDREGWPGETFRKPAKVDKLLALLTGGNRAFPFATTDSKDSEEVEKSLDKWRTSIKAAMKDIAEGKGLGEGVPGSGDAFESEDEDMDDLLRGKNGARNNGERLAAGDMEDIQGPGNVDSTKAAPKPMVAADSVLYKNLTKQGNLP